MMSGWGFSESPLVDDKVVVCTPGGPKGMLVALDKTTGSGSLGHQARCRCNGMVNLAARATRKNSKMGAGYASIVISNGGGVKQYVQTRWSRRDRVFALQTVKSCGNTRALQIQRLTFPV